MDPSASSFLALLSGLPKCQSFYIASSAFGQVSPNHTDWGGERAALGRRLVGDGGTRRPGPTLGWSGPRLTGQDATAYTRLMWYAMYIGVKQSVDNIKCEQYVE